MPNKSWKYNNMLLKLKEDRDEFYDKYKGPVRSPEEIESLRNKAEVLSQKVNEIFKAHGLLDFTIKQFDFKFDWNRPTRPTYLPEEDAVGIHLKLMKKDENKSILIEDIGTAGISYNDEASYEEFRDLIIGSIIRNTLYVNRGIIKDMLYVNKYPNENDLNEFQNTFNSDIEKIKGLSKDFDREIKSIY